jgi:hypothetical protein
MTLTLRPTGLAAPVDGDHKDFIVMSGEFALGRIYEECGARPELRWYWAINGVHAGPTVKRKDGRTRSLGAVCRQLAEVAGMGRIEASRVDASSIPAGSKSTNNLWGKLTRRRAADAKRRRALELLADSADGCTEAIMVAHGFTVDMLVELINAGLATASADARSPADTRWRYPRADHGGGRRALAARSEKRR